MTGQAAGAAATGRRAGQRIEWVDAAKGIGILAVIAGHVWWQPGMVHHMIYAFHMPLFFLLSGYMVRPQPTGALIVRQARSLFVPFIAFSLILIAVDRGVEYLRGVRPIFPSFHAAIEMIVLHTERLRGPFTILWFVPCLFLARIAWNGAARHWPDARDWRWTLLVVLVMACAHGVAARTSASPLGLMAVPAAFTLYWVGQLWKARAPGPGEMLLLLMPLAALTLVVLPPVNLRPGDFGLPFLSLAGAAAISILLCRLTDSLPHRAIALLARLGRASLVIMYVHVAFIHYLAPYGPKWALFAFALAGSLLVHRAAASTRPGRVLLLGEK